MAKDKIDEMMEQAKAEAGAPERTIGIGSQPGYRKVKIVSSRHDEGYTGVIALRDSVIEVPQFVADSMVDGLQCAYYTDEPLLLIEPPKGEG